MTDLPEHLTQLLQNSQLARHSAGVTVALRIGSEKFASMIGQSSLTFQQPLQRKTLFNIGSLTKHMIAVAVVELAQLGKLSLFDPLSQYLHEAHIRTWGGISLINLLSHTSGIPDCHSYFLWDQPTSYKTIVAGLSCKDADFLPGQAWAYSNSNYLLLGAVIEAVTGFKLRHFLDDHLFASAGLPHARSDSTWSVIPDRAEPYEIVRGNFVHAPRLHPTVTSLGGFGALFSIDDFLVWSEALYSGDRENYHQDCLTPVKLSDGMELPYGFGWYLGIMRGRSFAWHMGAPPGFRTIHLHLPSEKIAMSLSTNTSIEKTILKRVAFEILEQVLPRSTFLSIEPTEPASPLERQAVQALLKNKGEAPPQGILTEAMQYTWLCSPGSKPMNSIELEDCWLLEQHRLGGGTIKNYAAKAEGSLHHFSILWTEDQKIASLAM